MKPTIKFPCLNVRMVPREKVVANTWNPNSVPRDRLDLLRESIIQNGFCFPIVTIYDDEQDRYVIIDGFHRRMMCEPEWLDLPEVPIVVLEHTMAERLTATMQFNRARGAHQVDLDAEVVRALIGQGLSEEEIATKLGMDADTVHRYKQLTGVAELFKNADYSLAWEMADDDGDTKES
ncbi:MAG: ParB N-terminal domain-containing protein [Pseudomonadota bacterium]